ncbi:hypothetical protein R1sor_001950 [Riccia sorocarpa]|uniref:Uncharacterized protein n=1 Tax=Riccia sorocarpa TaxID=122646 RepID=A0ABD3GXD7_9MARC
MMTFPESHPTIIRPIGLSKDKKRPMLLFPLWNGGTLEKYINLEKRSRGRISPEGVRLSNEEFRANEEKREYKQAVYTRGLHIPNAAEVHGRLLREGLEKMTWKKICHPFRNQRRTMDFWAHYFNEQLFIDPVTCVRPIEYAPRAKVHPDGPQKVSRA